MQAAKERARQNAIDKGLLDVDRISPTPGMVLTVAAGSVAKFSDAGMKKIVDGWP